MADDKVDMNSTITSGDIYTTIDSTKYSIVNMTSNENSFTGFTIKQPKNYKWNPKEDITSWEIAKFLDIVFAISTGSVAYLERVIDNLPDNCKRHFEEIE